ncbi:uncharacterized protein BCR38DRAFT_489703 [Pseudomassariella vexata]|uniref:Uncharacterized protein n=1 Tax=Pseudomassariella vexata TaxID=1141098 RepID=A0A1Y2DG14_9PEZI|nr:uncharacterized protein BCR38DRAFT_489703 [Pseudomassariella vexata]ORY58233.1 hypothetical protein BCR38DRAFT_489703 [Pseudomassariella vexata]
MASLGQRIKDALSSDHSSEAERGDDDHRTPGAFPSDQNTGTTDVGQPHVGSKSAPSGHTHLGGTSDDPISASTSSHHKKLHKKNDRRSSSSSDSSVDSVDSDYMPSNTANDRQYDSRSAGSNAVPLVARMTHTILPLTDTVLTWPPAPVESVLVKLAMIVPFSQLTGMTLIQRLPLQTCQRKVTVTTMRTLQRAWV